MVNKDSQFELVATTNALDLIPVNKYKSKKTGITVIIADVEGPLVNGFFCLATEAHDDDGLPHTLEHLVFLGSERYPYKGVLDLLANRCLANGTNAWTDIDHTCYTVLTAGSDGMLTLLPIYLDHIMRPTLTDEGFITEVHHVDGDGEDAGVVYCEMQARENSADSRCELQMMRAMYPNFSYSSNVGGIMENLRTSTTNTKVRAFHKKFYRPENLTIILTGQIDAQEVFKALEIVENDLFDKVSKEQSQVFIKPWTTAPPNAPRYGEIREMWPADTEDNGQIIFGWRGPLLTEPNGHKTLTACAVLLRYLTETAAAPLQKCLVEREDALAGNVSCNVSETVAPLLQVNLHNIPVNKLEVALDQAKACLKSLRNTHDGMDMVRMKTLLRKQLRESYATTESDPHRSIAYRCIGDALYSNSMDDFISRMNPQKDLRDLMEEPSSYWFNLLQKYLTEDTVIVIGSPSIQLQTRMAEEEKMRIEAQKARLGEKGLAEKSMQLHAAMEFNNRPLPPGTIASVAVPSVSNVKSHNISTWSSDGPPCPYFDLKAVPIYARVHSLKTSFVYINLLLDTTGVDEKTRKWLPLHINALFESPVWRRDTLIPHQEVIATTEQMLVESSARIGVSARDAAGRRFNVKSFQYYVHVVAKCEPDDYEKVVNLLYEVLYKAELTKERLLVFAQRMSNDIAEIRRDGFRMTLNTLRDAVYVKDCNLHWSSVLRQQKFLKELIEQLNAGDDVAEAVINEAKTTYKTITARPWLHMASDLSKYKLSTKPWEQFARENEIIPPVPTLSWDAQLMTGWGGGFVVGVGGAESSFVARLAPGPLGYNPELLAPLLVAMSYFTQTEAAMWRLIRGAGLAYGYSMQAVPHEGRLMFWLYRATNTLAAYTKAKSILEEYMRNSTFDNDLFESAKSTTLFEAVELENCPADVVHQSLHNYLQKGGETYCRDLVHAIARVTHESAHEAAKKWLPTLFDNDKGKMSVVCHPSKVKEVQAQFDRINVKIEAYESMEDSHYNK